MRRIFAIWAVCLCWGILNAAPLGPFNATLLEQLKNDYQKGEKEVTRYIELQEKVAEKYIKMPPLSVTAKKKLPPSKDLAVTVIWKLVRMRPSGSMTFSRPSA